MSKDELFKMSLRIGMYKGSSPGFRQYRFAEKLRTHPELCLRFYVMIPRYESSLLEDSKLIIPRDRATQKDNRLYLNIKNIRGNLHWQLILLNARAFVTPEINHYIGAMKPAELHKDAQSNHYRTSFGLTSRPFIGRAYCAHTGYKPFPHRAIIVEFNAQTIDDSALIAISTLPISYSMKDALRVREEYPTIRLHQFPLVPHEEPLANFVEPTHRQNQVVESKLLPRVIEHNESPLKLKEDRNTATIIGHSIMETLPPAKQTQNNNTDEPNESSEELTNEQPAEITPQEPIKEPLTQEEEEQEATPAPQNSSNNGSSQADAAEATVTEAATPQHNKTSLEKAQELRQVRKHHGLDLVEEGSTLLEIINEWVEKMQQHTKWVPKITTHVGEDGHVRITLSLDHK